MDKELINKIQILKEIKPRSEWVFSAKQRIFEDPAPVIHVGSKISWGFFLKPAFALPAVLLLACSTFLYISNVNDIKTAQLEYDMKASQIEALTPVLESLQANISLARDNMDKANAGDLRTALKIKDNAKNVSKSGNDVILEVKRIIAQATSSDESGDRILASVVSAEKALEDYQESYQMFVKRMIEDAEHYYLGEEEQKNLENAKQYYEEGEYDNALMEIYRISYPF